MLTFLLIVAAGLLYLLVYELLRNKLHLSNEYSRKTFHAVHGVLVGMAPFFISYRWIIAFELLLFIEMLLVRRYRLLRWLYQVGRVSWGDFFTVAGVVIVALMHPNKWIFLAAMLHLGLADAAAALVGKRYGKSTSYKVFGQTKSLAGSLAFYAVSIAIMIGIVHFGQLQPAFWPIILLLPPLVTLGENVSIFGSDNMVIPILVVLLLAAS
ncbi:MAG TPA: hypothetical protein VLF87_00835 [Patescibacteria group bacterium]|nr:hypothetical protein [Patescibacteria group bacterium]